MDTQEYYDEDDDLDYGYETVSLRQVILGYRTYLLIEMDEDDEVTANIGGSTEELGILLKNLPRISKVLKKDLKQQKKLQKEGNN